MELIKPSDDFLQVFLESSLHQYWHTVSNSTDGSPPLVDRIGVGGNPFPALMLGRGASVEQRFYDFVDTPDPTAIVVKQPLFNASKGRVSIAYTTYYFSTLPPSLDNLIRTVLYLDGTEKEHPFEQKSRPQLVGLPAYYDYEFNVRPDKFVKGLRMSLRATEQSAMEATYICNIAIISMEGYKTETVKVRLPRDLPLLWKVYWPPLLVGVVLSLLIGTVIWLSR